jgi:Lysyl oxidase/Chitobiase/beta-hexosaminidase C-terminal domain/Bacterial pre-peptidase C-terminal domain
VKTFKHLRSVVFALVFGLVCAVAALAPTAAVAQTAASPQPLANGVSVGPLSGAKASLLYYSFTVPAGATQASFAINVTPGTAYNDADIYVKYGAVPTESVWDYRPYTDRSNETVTVAAPQAGTWYVMVRGYTAYSSVFVKALHNATDGTVAAAPVFTPAPGTYSGQVSVQLTSSTPNAVMRFTLNGTTPSASSEVYIAPILVTATTEIRAAAFATGYTTSAVTAGTFTIRDTVQALSNNVPIANLSGALNSTTNFKFSVPAGAATVTFSIAGSSPDADLYVKYGQLATTSVWDQRPYLSTSNETVVINAPQAGDYFLMVHGYTAYSGLTIKATYSGTATVGKPDIVVWGPAINPYITTETFASNACEIEEGTITAGTKKLLRFTTQTRNIGTADLVLGNPATSPSFQYAPCHGHYHFNSFAQYRLLYAAGGVARVGKKVGFCLMDIARIDGTANPSGRYNCSNQGIQAGWADVYSSNLSGQWIDITGLPAGQYILEISMDPLNFIDELDETNNVTSVAVTIP